MKTGLVMEGGAMRGLFTAGVLDVLMENKITFTGAVGVSAGTGFGVNIKSGQKGRVLRYSLRFAENPHYASWQSWRRSGNLYARDFCFHLIPTKFDPVDRKAFAENPMQFWSVATNAKTGKAKYVLLRNGDYEDLEWVRASAAIPFFAHPVAIHGNFYFDGGVADSIPIKFAQKHYDKNVVILTRPKDFKMGLDKFWPLEKMLLRQYPAILPKIKNRPHDYNATLAYIKKEEKAGRVFAIRPPFALKIGTVENDKQEIKRTYQIGRREMEKQLPALKKFLAEK